MRWTVVVAGDPPSDLAAICDRTGTADAPIPMELAVAGHLRRLGDEEGVVIVGSDADLARAAAAVGSSGAPLTLVPTGRSDLLRMFGLDRAGAIARIGRGSRYPCDLGWCQTAHDGRPFVSHVVASPPPLSRMTGRNAPVEVDTGVRRHQVRARRIVVCNAQHVTDRTLAPKASVADGLLDLQAFGGPRRAALATTRRTRRGLHLGDPGVWRRTAAAAEVRVPSRWIVRIDGEVAGSGPITVSVEKGSFDLWI